MVEVEVEVEAANAEAVPWAENDILKKGKGVVAGQQF